MTSCLSNWKNKHIICAIRHKLAHSSIITHLKSNNSSPPPSLFLLISPRKSTSLIFNKTSNISHMLKHRKGRIRYRRRLLDRRKRTTKGQKIPPNKGYGNWEPTGSRRTGRDDWWWCAEYYRYPFKK